MICNFCGTETKSAMGGVCSAKCHKEYSLLSAAQGNSMYRIPVTHNQQLPIYHVPPSLDTPIIKSAAEFVKKEMENCDASHDWFHVERVWNLTRRIYECETIAYDIAGVDVNWDPEALELAAILHDVDDWKYSRGETTGPGKVHTFLESQGFDPLRVDLVVKIVAGVGFSSELGQTDNNDNQERDFLIHLGIVQDADRLDAIGAIGIARTFAFGTKKGNAFYDPEIKPRLGITKQQYKSKAKSTTINHFYEKLLKLPTMMKTESGRTLAKERYGMMRTFLHNFFLEAGVPAPAPF